MTKELQCSNRKKTNMTTFPPEKSCNRFLAPMQNNEENSSYINMINMAKFALKNSQKATDNATLC